MKLTMRDRSQRPQLSVAVAEVGWEGPEAQPLNRSDSTNAFATAKQKILLRLPSFMAFSPSVRGSHCYAPAVLPARGKPRMEHQHPPHVVRHGARGFPTQTVTFDANPLRFIADSLVSSGGT